MDKCPNCGAPMQNGICIYCHYTKANENNNDKEFVVINNVYKQTSTNTNRIYEKGVSPQNKWIALILCIFFGYIGLHRFYTGKITTGLIYLFTLGIFGFGCFIDFILILCGGFKDTNGLPLKN